MADPEHGGTTGTTGTTVPAADDRDRIADDRDRIADDRDRIADDRDRVADADDLAAKVRDDRAKAREQEFLAEGASDRLEASKDRSGAASDRAHSADDRQVASSERAVSAQDRLAASLDQLTGAHNRDAGLVELDRELARARRSGRGLLLAYLDVDGLKATNDSLGHQAGDQLLRTFAETTRANLRPYDLFVRWGGDEFICGLSDMTVAHANERFSRINAILVTMAGASVAVGLAELRDGDTVEQLVDRADQAMYRERSQRPPEPD